MRVFIAGGTGAIGRTLVPALIAAGHQVTATTRSPAKAAELRAAGAEPAVADGLNKEQVIAAVKAAAPDVIVHEMTSLSALRSFRKFDSQFAVTNELRTKGTDYLLEAATEAGVRRVVAQGFTGWPNQRSGGPVKNEDDPLEGGVPDTERSLAAIRYVEERVPAAVAEGLVLRYGGFYGPGASQFLLDQVRKRRVPTIGGGTGIWSFTEITDAAAATVAAVERGAPGVYNIVDDEPAPVSEWLPYLAKVLDAKPPLRVPAWLGRLAAGELAVVMMTTMRGSSNAKAKRELDWTPRYASWREGFRAWARG
jgi:2-alkyl-3-oxoalkanoate reductase